MNAQHRLAQKLSAYLDGELAPDEMEGVRLHLIECPSCEAELIDLRANKRLLSQLRTPEPPVGFEQALRARVEPGTRVRSWWPVAWWPRPAMALAALALAVALVTVPVLRGQRDRLRAAEIGPDLFIRAAAHANADDPFADRAYLGLVVTDANLRIAGEDPRGTGR